MKQLHQCHSLFDVILYCGKNHDIKIVPVDDFPRLRLVFWKKGKIIGTIEMYYPPAFSLLLEETKRIIMENE